MLSLVIQMMERSLDKPRAGQFPTGKVKSLSFVFPVRDDLASSFGSAVNIMASYSRIYETSTSDFYRITSPKAATFDERNDPLASVLDRGASYSVGAKKGTGPNIVPTPDT